MKTIVHVSIAEALQFGHVDVPTQRKKKEPFLVRNGTPLFWDKAYVLRAVKAKDKKK